MNKVEIITDLIDDMSSFLSGSGVSTSEEQLKQTIETLIKELQITIQ